MKHEEFVCYNLASKFNHVGIYTIFSFSRDHKIFFDHYNMFVKDRKNCIFLFREDAKEILKELNARNI